MVRAEGSLKLAKRTLGSRRFAEVLEGSLREDMSRLYRVFVRFDRII